MGCPWSVLWGTVSPEDQLEDLQENLKELEKDVSQDERKLERAKERAKNRSLGAEAKKDANRETMALRASIKQKRVLCGNMRATIRTIESAMQQSEYAEQQRAVNKAMHELKRKVRGVAKTTETAVQLQGTLNERSREQYHLMTAAGQVADEEMREFLDGEEEEDEDMYGTEEEEEDQVLGEKEEERRVAAHAQETREAESMASTSRNTNLDKEFGEKLLDML